MRFIPVFNILFLLAISQFLGQLNAATKKTDSLEQKWLNILKKSPVKHQLVTLKSKKGPTTGLYMVQTSGQPQGGLIILHGRLQHPDWRELIAPLRSRFPKFGWATLSIQLPLHSEPVNKKEYAQAETLNNARIDAAIIFLNSRKIRNIVIVAYELGANTAARYLLKKNRDAVHAFISISLLNFAKPEKLNANRAMSLLKLPILDVYAMNDSKKVLEAVKQRKPLASQHRHLDINTRDPKNAMYRQLEIEGADHSYSGYEDFLIKRLRSWLRLFAPGKSISHS
ncbi:hypothetical protein MNBD_GAMMA12-784 [hydrothermal vent metagenome]|uniref:DUF3530 family protein n=1 Tax=hydrothermal vent metagenome TaxID=652676 RepID=A0A3B0Y351_9ZZZZ